MMLSSHLRRVFVVAVVVCAPGFAQENENAVPLLLGLEPGNASLGKISVTLDGREVSVSTQLNNGGATPINIGWYASTPHFGILGISEEHADKSFADVRATVDGKVVYPALDQRGYFIGRDITAQLLRAGLPSLPVSDPDVKKLARLGPIGGMKPEQWQGSVNYAWTATLAVRRSATIAVHYRALPAFALLDVNSAPFEQMVQQHCGDPVNVRRQIHATAADAVQIVLERYDIPLQYLRLRDVDVSIVQPKRNWLQALPFLTLVCGLPNVAQAASPTGTVRDANAALSILVISAIDVPLEPRSDHDGK